MITIKYDKLCLGYLVKWNDNPLFEREVYTAEEIGQLLGGH